MQKGLLPALGLGLMLGLVSSPANAQLSSQEVKELIESTYPVDVLDEFTKLVDFDGGRAYLVKVMNLGGDFNEAFMVNTLVVDADTGELLSVFRHGESGYTLPDGGDRNPNRQPADSAREGHIWR